jgi:hypothetical protein
MSARTLLSLITSSTASLANRFPRVSSTLKGNNSILVFDCIPEYTEEYSNDISSFPIERGTDITDHVVHKNPDIQLRGIVTSIYHRLGKTLIPSIKMKNGEITINQNTTPGDWKDAYKTLKNMWESRALLTLGSVLGEHQNLIIKDMSFPKTSANFGSLEVNLTLQKVRVVSTQVGIVPVPDELLKKADPKDSGKGQTSFASGEDLIKKVENNSAALVTKNALKEHLGL